MIETGLIGRGIAASRSPAMHEREAAAQGLQLRYRLFDLDGIAEGEAALPRLLDDAQAQGFAGLNITHPVKQAVIPFLDELSDDARAIGAVNTVSFADGRRTGYNTDATGFAASVRRGLPDVSLARVVQLGAGGAGAATAHALLGLGVRRLALEDVDRARAERLAAALRGRFTADVAIVEDLPAEMAAASGLVHATPTGMRDHPGLPLDPALLHAGLWVADIVYFPIATELLRTAAAIGCRTLDGGGMAVAQAAGAFRVFTGRDADIDRMLAAFAADLNRGEAG